MFSSLIGALALLVSPPAQASEIGSGNNIGLGVLVGQPTGLSAKAYLGGPRNAVDVALATGWWSGLYAHGTYLWHPGVITTGNNVTVPWHVGVGGFIWSWDGPNWKDGPPPHWKWEPNTGAGVRVPVGLDVNLGEPRLQFFADVALNVLVVPGVALGADGSVGARYYF